jgi:hypothetical protein
MLIMVLSVAMSACAWPSAGSPPLPFELREHAIIVPVGVPDAGQFRFLLDTGASRTVISARVAARVRAIGRTRTLMVTPTGHAVRPAAELSLGLGTHPAVPVTATILGENELTRTGLPVDGILGQDVLSALVYTIDYARRVIVFDRCADVRDDQKVPLEFEAGRAMVTIPAQPGLKQALRLIPDTGADTVVLYTRRGRPLPASTARDVGVIRTLAGQQLVRRVTLDSLRIGGATLAEHEAVLLETGGRESTGGDGLLPLHLFSRVTVNGPEGYIAVEK